VDPYKPPDAELQTDAEDAIPGPQAAAVQARLNKLNRISFGLALPGLGLQFAAGEIGVAVESAYVGIGVSLLGTGLFILGLSFYSEMRGRGRAWCLFGLLSCIGLLVLYFIPKHCLNCNTASSFRVKKCPNCRGPLPG
jgi:hypothetical protein